MLVEEDTICLDGRGIVLDFCPHACIDLLALNNS